MAQRLIISLSHLRDFLKTANIKAKEMPCEIPPYSDREDRNAEQISPSGG
jgi:hypothetical protein